MPRRVATGAVLVVASAWATWPWAFPTGRGFPHRDALFTQIAQQHAQDVVLRGADWRTAPLGWPLADGTTQADWTPAQALLALPLRLIGMPPEAWYTVLALLGLVGTAVVAHQVATRLIGSGTGAWVAAVGTGFGALQLVHARHVNLTWHGPPLLAAASTWIALRRGSPWLALAAGALATSCFHLGFYLGVHAALLVTIVAGVAAWTWRPRLRTVLALTAGLAAGAVTVLPPAWLYHRAQQAHRLVLDATIHQDESADLASFLLPNPSIALHPAVGLDLGRFTDSANPGYVLLILGAIGLVAVLRDRNRHPAWWAVVLVGAVSAALALGPWPRFADVELGVPGPFLALRWIPGLDGLRAPVRWLMLGQGALALLAGAGVQALLRRWPRFAVPIAGAALALVLAELPGSDPLPLREARARPVADRLAELAEPGAVLVLHRKGDRAASQRRLAGVLRHRRPLAGGEYARPLAALEAFDTLAATWPAPAARDLLRWTGVRFVVLDGLTAPAGLGCERVDRDHLCPVQGPPVVLPGPTSTAPHGPVLGVEVEALDADRIELGCPGRPPERSWTTTWRTLAAIAEHDTVAVWFQQPCPDLPDRAPLGARPVYAAR